MTNHTDTDDFLDWLRTRRGARPNTLAKYRQIIDTFDTWGAGKSFPAMTADDVEAFSFRPRRTGKPPAAATVAMEVAVLGSLYRWGQARHQWPTNAPALAARPRVHNRQPRPIDDELWLAVWTQDLPVEARVALGLGYFCGLRREEITTLRAHQVTGGHLVDFTRKGGGEDRFDYGDVLDHFAATMPDLLPARLEAPLRWLARTRGTRLLMPWGDDWIAPTGLNKRLRHWLADAGLEPGAFTPHMLRHSFATNLLRSGVPLDLASDLCNHSSPTITMRYVRTSGGRLRALRGDGVAPQHKGRSYGND